MRKKLIALATLLTFLTVCTISMVYAQEPAPDETVSPIAELFESFGYAVPSAFVIAFVTSMLGYLRNTPPESFEVSKFIATLIISILIGVITVTFGFDYTTAVAWLANAGVTIWVYWFAKAIAIKMGWAAATTAPKPPT